MPHRDPETGQFVPGDGGGGGVDYSDFEYEHHHIESRFDGPTSTDGASLRFTVDPVEDFGGLESDELAEIVAIFYMVHAQENHSTADNVGSTMPVAVTHGINLSEDEVPVESAAESNGELVNNEGGWDDNDGASAFILRSVTEPGVLWHRTGRVKSRHDDTTNGLGIGDTPWWVWDQVHYRSMVGRGPILDPTDDMNWWIRINVGSLESDPIVDIAQTTVYDTVEVSNKRARFSVP